MKAELLKLYWAGLGQYLGWLEWIIRRKMNSN